MDERKFVSLLKHFLEHGENDVLEFKKDNEDKAMIARSISALSNAAALRGIASAYMVWGIEDETGHLIGTTFTPSTTKIQGQEIGNWLSTHLNPSPAFTFDEHIIENKRIVFLSVQASSQTPTTARIDKSPARAYIRIGSSTKPLEDFPELQRKLWERLIAQSAESSIVMDSMTVNDIARVLDIPALYDFIGEKKDPNDDMVVDRLRRSGLLAKTGPYLYGIPRFTAMLAAKDLREFPELANIGIRVVVYSGKNRLTPAIADVEYNQGLAVSFSQAYNQVIKALPTRESINLDTAKRENVPVLPALAIREVIANAVIHQDLGKPMGRVMVEVFSNRIEVSNPGTPLIDPRRFIDMAPLCRNEQLAKYMRIARFAESRGSGWDKILLALEENALPAPEVKIVPDASTTIILWHRKPLEMMGSDERNWTVYLHTALKQILGEDANNASLRHRLGLTDSQKPVASKMYRQALETGLIAIKDEKASPKYRRYVPFWEKTASDRLSTPTNDAESSFTFPAK